MTMEPIIEPPAEPFESSFRVAKTEYLITPPTSGDEYSSQDQELNTAELFKSFTQGDDEPQPQAAFRRRVGRNGRIWIDRRGLPPSPESSFENENSVPDQWKYDQDSDDETPVYLMDPYDTSSLRFRAMLPGNGPRPRPPQQQVAGGPRVPLAAAAGQPGQPPPLNNIRLNSNSNISIPIQRQA